ncbi:MAG TPA: C4-type zinc ribbon domain-containing protein [Candidatus Acidoferrales bacterium]|nr:C4-type zinc ribbon domain-containing protein [Candidatus Acidoferrales bacterium]
MQKILQTLLDLQSVDIRLHEVRARLATLPKKTAEIDARVAAAKATLEQSKAAQLNTIKERKKYELDVEQWKERVRKYRDQTSQVKTNEAYKALQHEVEMAEAEISKAEDRLLEQMVNAEEYDRRVKASEKDLKEVEDAARGQRAKIDAEKATADKDIAALEAERARAVADIPENLLDHYDRIVRKHNGVALAEVRDSKCGACGMIVRPHVLQEMRRAKEGDDLFHCETCTRILYYIEVDQPGAPASDPARQASASAAAGEC